MTPEPPARRSIEQVLDLLNDPAFCDDAWRVIADAARLRGHALALDQSRDELVHLGASFVTRWGIPPPPSAELLQPDPRWGTVAAIASGRWGLVPVFPWTTRLHVHGQIKRIRTVIGKQHRDALVRRPAQLTLWLEICGFDRPTIARVVFARRSGLCRVTKTEAIARISEDRERELFEHFRRRGVPEPQIEDRIFRTFRGSEPRATATVRMAARRYLVGVELLNVALAAPLRSEPVSHALTMLFRALPTPDTTIIRQHADAVHAALIDAPEADGGTPNSAGREAILAGRWGLLRLFTWTTDPDIRAATRRIRTRMRACPGKVVRPETASGPPRLDPLCQALSGLLKTLSDHDDAAVRRQVFAARTAVLGTAP